MTANGLPPSWEVTKLGDIALWSSGGTPRSGTPEFYGGDIPWVVTGDLTDGPVRATVQTITELGLARSSAKLVPAGTVLVAMYGASIGRVGIASVPLTTNQAIANAQVHADAASPEYILYYLLSQRNALAAAGKGAAQPNIGQGVLKAWPIPVAPRIEQDRVVAAIEEQLSRLDAGVEGLKRAQQNLKRMRDAVLQAAVTGQLVPHSRNEDVAGMLKDIAQQRRTTWASATAKPYREPADPGSFPLSVPEHWRIASLESLTSPTRVICYGILMPKEDVRDGVPYVRVKDMKGWSIDLAGLKRTSPEIAANYARASLETNDLLAIRGSYGRVAIVPPALSGGNITQDSARIAAHQLIDHRYLLYYLGGSVANRYYQRVARGVAVKGVNIGDLRTMPVPVPPREEQAAIAEEVERQFTVLDQIEKAVQVNLRLAATLRSSVLAVAFSGALVQQNPDDEPAVVTLERIAATHTSCNGRKSSHNATRRIKGTK